MLVFLPIFAADTGIIPGYSFGATLKISDIL